MADFTCSTNYLVPTGFKVSISRENYPNLEFFAQAVQHPSMDMTPSEVAYPRVGSIVTPGDTISFGTLNMDVLMDENMKVYEELYEWFFQLVNENHKNNTGRMFDTAKSSYCDIRVTVLTSHNNGNRTIKYLNALPISLGDIAFTATSDEQYISFPATFRFDYFEFS